MRRVETGRGLPRMRVVVLLREMDARGKTIRSRSETISPDLDEVLPSLDEALDAATTAVIRLSRQVESTEEEEVVE